MKRVIHIEPFPSPVKRVQLYTVTYWSGTLKVKGLLATMDRSKSEDIVIYLRGGINRVGQVRPAKVVQLAQQGVHVFAPFYRGNRGGEGCEDFVGEDRYDAIYAVDAAKELVAHTNRIHLYGFSRGGVMALWTAIERHDITSLVTWGGVSDVFLTYEERVDLRRMLKRVIGGTPTKRPEGYAWRTPLSQMERLTCPVLIIHGIRDTHVTIEHAYRLERALRPYQYETKYEANYAHVFPTSENLRTVREMVAWMKRQPISFSTENA